MYLEREVAGVATGVCDREVWVVRSENVHRIDSFRSDISGKVIAVDDVFPVLDVLPLRVAILVLVIRIVFLGLVGLVHQLGHAHLHRRSQVEHPGVVLDDLETIGVRYDRACDGGKFREVSSLQLIDECHEVGHCRCLGYLNVSCKRDGFSIIDKWGN